MEEQRGSRGIGSRILLLSISMALVACSKSPTMTEADFETIHIGMDINRVKDESGKPYTVRSTDQEGVVEYLYIERIQLIPDTHEQNHYILTVKNGRVVDKTKEHLDAPFDFTLE